MSCWKYQFPFEHQAFKQLWVRIILGCVTALELLMLLAKATAGLYSGAHQPSRWAANLFQSVQALGKNGLCSSY